MDYNCGPPKTFHLPTPLFKLRKLIMKSCTCYAIILLSSSGNYGDDVEVCTHSEVDHSQNNQTSQRINQDGDTLLVQGLIPFGTTEDELAAYFNVCIIS